MALEWLRTLVGLTDMRGTSTKEELPPPVKGARRRRRRQVASMDIEEDPVDEIQALFKEVANADTAKPLGGRVRFPPSHSEGSTPVYGDIGARQMLRPRDYSLIPDGFVLVDAQDYGGVTSGLLGRMISIDYCGKQIRLVHGAICVFRTSDHTLLSRMVISRWGLIPVGLQMDGERLVVVLAGDSAISFGIRLGAAL